MNLVEKSVTFTRYITKFRSNRQHNYTTWNCLINSLFGIVPLPFTNSASWLLRYEQRNTLLSMLFFFVEQKLYKTIFFFKFLETCVIVTVSRQPTQARFRVAQILVLCIFPHIVN